MNRSPLRHKNNTEFPLTQVVGFRAEDLFFGKRESSATRNDYFEVAEN
jgi:hypothetical protein